MYNRMFLYILILILCKLAIADTVINLELISTTVSITTYLVANITFSNLSSKIIFVLPIQFTIVSTNCTVNSLNATCATTNSANNNNITFTGSYSSNQLFSFQVINPSYQNNFEIFIYNNNIELGGGSFIVSTTPYPATCSLSSSSQTVGAASVGIFTITSNKSSLSIPTGSIIFINFIKQTIFPDIISNINSIVCNSTLNTNLLCGLSSIDNSSYTIGVTNMFITNFNSNSVSFNISIINNPPYNNSFGLINIQITNDNAQGLYSCSLTQTSPTTLATTGSTISGWSSTINTKSTIQITLIPTVYIPSNFTILIVYPITLKMYINPPATSINTSDTQNNYLTVSNIKNINNLTTFNITINNPSSVMPLSITLYYTYNVTYFISKINIPFTLTGSVLNFNATLSATTVMTYNSTLNIIGNFSDTINNGSIIISSVFGNFGCSSSSNFFANINGVNFSINSCNNTYLSIPVINFSGSNTISINYGTPLSIQSDTIIVKTQSSPNNYSISQGSRSISFIMALFYFNVINNNLILNSNTTFNIYEYNNSYISNTNSRRICSLTMPNNLQLGTSVTVVGNKLNSYSLNQYTLTLDINGLLNITISNIKNPNSYNGDKTWAIFCQDQQGYNSSSGTSNQSAQYQPIASSLSLSLSNNIIETNVNCSFNVKQLLNNLNTSTISIYFPNVSIIMPCVNLSCTIVDSNIIKFTYVSNLNFTSIIRTPYIPGTYSATLSIITNNNLTVETAVINYTIIQMQYHLTSKFSGFFQQSGLLNINVTQGPTTIVNLNYDVSSIFSSKICINCSSQYLYLSGIVAYFTTVSITITGTLNNVIYAVGSVVISYPCSTGCQICNGSICLQCFNSTYTNFTYYYNQTCLSACPSSTYVSSDSCILCQSNCYNCNSSQCLMCMSNYIYYNGQCLSSCPQNYIINNGTCIFQPIVCQVTCSICLSVTFCTTCVSKYLLYNGSCFTACPYGLISNGTNCITPPIPLSPTNYVPFPFLITCLVILIILLFFKRFDKRSLVLGNFIALSTICELGAIGLFLSYVLLSNTTILIQALSFIAILSKLGCNIFFLIYFIIKVSKDEKYENWIKQTKGHLIVQIIIMMISILSHFEVFRLIYSRLLGMQLFFARFTTSLIFKPLFYLNFAYFFTTGACLIVLASLMLFNQHTVYTSLFYSSIQIIIIEIMIFVVCILDDRKNSDEHFDYQIYKIKNEYLEDKIPQIKEESMAEVVGNIHILNKDLENGNSFESEYQNFHETKKSLNYGSKEQSEEYKDNQKKKSSQKNIKNIFSIDSEQQRMQTRRYFEKFSEDIAERYKGKNLFRKKILDQWREMKHAESQHLFPSPYLESGRMFRSLPKQEDIEIQIKKRQKQHSSAQKLEYLKSPRKKDKIKNQLESRNLKNVSKTITINNPLETNQQQIINNQQNNAANVLSSHIVNHPQYQHFGDQKNKEEGQKKITTDNIFIFNNDDINNNQLEGQNHQLDLQSQEQQKQQQQNHKNSNNNQYSNKNIENNMLKSEDERRKISKRKHRLKQYPKPYNNSTEVIYLQRLQPSTRKPRRYKLNDQF